MRRLTLITACAALCVAATCTASGGGAPAPSGPPLHIGVDLPLTGDEARAAIPALNGVRFYVTRHPTLGGFVVSLTARDDALGGAPSAARGAANVERFIADPNLVAMIGPFDSAVARAEIPIGNAANLAIVSPATGNPCLTRDVYLPAALNPARTAISCKDAGVPAASELRTGHPNNYFRLTTTDDLQGPAAADYMFRTLHLFRAAVITDHESYGEAMATAFTARLQRLGGTVVGRFVLDSKAPEASAFLESMKNAGAQAVYFGSTAGNRGCLVRSEMSTVFPTGEATPFLSDDGVAEDPACIEDAGGNFSGIFATAPLVDASSLASAAGTIADFKSAYGSTSDYGPYTMLGYDAAAVVYAAVQRAIEARGQLPARPSVIAQLSTTSGLQGVTGTIGFDAAGDTTNRIVTLFEPASSDPRDPWKVAAEIDYSARPPF